MSCPGTTDVHGSRCSRCSRCNRHRPDPTEGHGLDWEHPSIPDVPITEIFFFFSSIGLSVQVRLFIPLFRGTVPRITPASDRVVQFGDVTTVGYHSPSRESLSLPGHDKCRRGWCRATRTDRSRSTLVTLRRRRGAGWVRDVPVAVVCVGG